MGEVFRKAEAAIYLFAGLLVVLGAVYVLGEALVQGVGLFLGGGGSTVAVFLLGRVLLALLLHDLGATQDSREIWMKRAAERPDMPELAGLVR